MIRIENKEGTLCSGGCFQIATHYSNRSKRFWCDSHMKKCPIQRKKSKDVSNKNWKNDKIRETIIKKQKDRCSDPEYRQKQKEKVIEYYNNNPEKRDVVSKEVKKRYDNTEYRKKMKERDISWLHTEEVRKKISIALKKRWQEEEFREKGIKRIKDAVSKKEVREKMSAHQKDRWTLPEYEDYRTESLKRLKSKDRRKLTSEKAKKRWENEEYRKRMAEIHAQKWKEGKFSNGLLTVEKIKKYYPLFYKIENPVEIDGKIMVKCRNSQCKKLFKPTKAQLTSRIYSIERLNKDWNGFYCSRECKGSCPLYRYNSSNNIDIGKRIPIPIWLKKKIVELQSGFCIGCGSPIDHTNSTIHHIIPRIKNPYIEMDIDNLIAFCNNKDEDGKYCHYKFGHSSEDCTTAALRNSKCFEESEEEE